MAKQKQEELTELQAKRVAILKDAIAQIKTEKYKIKADHGYVYLDNEGDLYDLAERAENKERNSSKKIELKTYINKLVTKEKPCTVCAKGALLISAVRKFNNLSLHKAITCDLADLATPKTRRIFGRKNADLMEQYFENPSREQYPNDTDRVIAIFKNAIKNKGIFKP